MPQDHSRQQVLDIIEAEAKQRGIPRDDFLRFAYIETGGTFNERASRGPPAPRACSSSYRERLQRTESRGVNSTLSPIRTLQRDCTSTTGAP